jgi:hypothetical protein
LLVPKYQDFEEVNRLRRHGESPSNDRGQCMNADFRGRENNQAFGGQVSQYSGDFLIPMSRFLIIFPAQHPEFDFVSAFAEP